MRSRAGQACPGSNAEGGNLEEELPASDGTQHRSSWSADQKPTHARVVAVTPIAFDVRAEESARKESTDTAGDGAKDAFLRSCVSF